MKRKEKRVKSKTSSVKQRNRLRNKGKLKVKRHAHRIVTHPQRLKNTETIMKNVESEDVRDMLEDDEVDFMHKSVRDKKYGFLNQIDIKHSSRKLNKKSTDDKLEEQYEESNHLQSEYNTRMLLPIKTKDGIIKRYTDVREDVGEEPDGIKKRKIEVENKQDDEEVAWLEKETDITHLDLSAPISIARIYAKREDIVRKYKFKIGLLSSGLLENPEQKIGNLSLLLNILDKNDPELQITVKKLVTLSLMEIFKDLLPSYLIKHQDIPMNKLKKVTRELVGYESQLLKGYKEFLTKLEKLASCLRRKRGDNRTISQQQKGLGILALKCLCELLISHPYFNYSSNIVQLLTIYLDNPCPTVRKIVEECYIKVFHQDKKAFISLLIVRRINHLVKSRAHSVHCEVLSVLLSLRIKNVNLDDEKEQEINSKKFMTRKQKLLTMSRKERKRTKELEKLDKEMLEAKAEENMKSKQVHFTEITKVVFLIYFRILKTAPRSNLLSITLEGLAKFADCINLEYYQDLMIVLDNLLEKERLTIKEQLYCIKTVFIILSGHGEALNIDPVHFYTHLYKIILQVNCAGKEDENVKILLSTLEAVLVNRRNKVTTQRMLSFTKRVATFALGLLHNGALGSLNIVKSVLQLTKSADVLLDLECTYGQGIYNAELEEPEYCNAANTALWELTALKRHYHPVVRKLSSHISCGVPTTGEGSLDTTLTKMTTMEYYEAYDPTNVAFKPAITPPNLRSKFKRINSMAPSKFIEKTNQELTKIPNTVDFSIILL